jgi:hypothetical protein
MGEIADMMLDGTMDPETGEWNFDGEDGPGFPMTGAEAAEWKRLFGSPSQRREPKDPNRPRPEPAFKVKKALRKKVEAFGSLRNNDRYHWQVRDGDTVVADWWPHKRKWRIAGRIGLGDEAQFVAALANRGVA